MVNQLRVNRAPVILRIIFALLFSFIYIFSPLCQMVLEDNPDIKEYLLIIDSLLIGTHTDIEEGTFLEYLLNEPLWLYIMTLIGEFFYRPMDGLILVSFFCTTVITFFLCGRVNLFLASFFLYNPLVVDLLMAQVRSAFAASLCLIALMINKRLISLILVLIAFSVHSSMFIVFGVYSIAKFLESKRNSSNYKQLGITALFFGLVLGNTFGGGRAFLQDVTGDRRFTPPDPEHQSSLLFVSYWMLLAIALALPFIQRYDDKIREYWTSYYSIVILSIPFITTFYTMETIRFIPLCFPILLYSMYTYTAPVRALLMGSMFVYQLVHYTYYIHT